MNRRMDYPQIAQRPALCFRSSSLRESIADGAPFLTKLLLV